MVTRADIIAEAETWIGTPFVWQADVKGRGCDCKGLLVGIARELRLPEADSIASRLHAYRTDFSPAMMAQGLSETLIPTDDPKPADIVAFEIGKVAGPRHLALLMPDNRIVHCYGKGPSRVISAPIGRSRKVHSYWTWPSLQGA